MDPRTYADNPSAVRRENDCAEFDLCVTAYNYHRRNVDLFGDNQVAMRTERWGMHDKNSIPSVDPPESRHVLLAVGTAVVLVLGLGVAVSLDESAQKTWEQYRPEAQAYCQENPEMKYRKYLNADGSDPDPDMDAFEYCVAAHLSHMPPPGAD